MLGGVMPSCLQPLCWTEERMIQPECCGRQICRAARALSDSALEGDRAEDGGGGGGGGVRLARQLQRLGERLEQIEERLRGSDVEEM